MHTNIVNHVTFLDSCCRHPLVIKYENIAVYVSRTLGDSNSPPIGVCTVERSVKSSGSSTSTSPFFLASFLYMSFSSLSFCFYNADTVLVIA